MQYPRGNTQILARMLEDFLLSLSLGMGGAHKPSRLGMLKIGPRWIYPSPAGCPSSGKAEILGIVPQLLSAQCTLVSEWH